jgi:hypothetical protein
VVLKYPFVKKMGNGTFVTHYKKAFVGELEATYKNNPTTPSLNY